MFHICLNLCSGFVSTGSQDERGDDGAREGDRDGQEEVGGHGEPQQGPQQREERPPSGDLKILALTDSFETSKNDIVHFLGFAYFIFY